MDVHGVYTLASLSSSAVAKHFKRLDPNCIRDLPSNLRRVIAWKLTPMNLRLLELTFNNPNTEEFDAIWMKNYIRDFIIHYRNLFKLCQTNEQNFCVAPRSASHKYRQLYLEDHFHVLLEDANKVITLIQRGIERVNLAVNCHHAEENATCCKSRMAQICADMLICARHVQSLKVTRSNALLNPALSRVLEALLKSVVCLKIVFLQDSRAIRETVELFKKKGHMLDLHFNYQPQRCFLPVKCSIDILKMLSGLEFADLEPIDDEPSCSSAIQSRPRTDQSVTHVAIDDAENPYDLYDIAVAGSRLDRVYQDYEMVEFDCAISQSGNPATHLTLTSFLLTQNRALDVFLSNTLLPRWLSLQSIKFSCLTNHISIDIFKAPILYLLEHHNLRQICFEDTRFTDPMDLFISIIRILMKHKDIVLKKLTMLDEGQCFSGDFSHELISGAPFDGIQHLDLSFSTLSDPSCVPTLCSYILNDQVLTSLNLNACKLPSSDRVSSLLHAIAKSNISELVLGFNPVNVEEVEEAFIYMLEENKAFATLSFTLCSFNPEFLKNHLFPSLSRLPKLTRLYLAENRIGDLPELANMICKLLETREQLLYLDLSSNFHSGAFLLYLSNRLNSLERPHGYTKPPFHGLNLNYNLDRGEVQISKDIVRREFSRLCSHLSCLILYEDPAEPARLEHMAQM